MIDLGDNVVVYVEYAEHCLVVIDLRRASAEPTRRLSFAIQEFRLILIQFCSVPKFG